MDQRVGEKQLIYFDNAATSQKPTQVTDSLDDYYRRCATSLWHVGIASSGRNIYEYAKICLCLRRYNSNVHRGVHHLSALATAAYEEARAKVAKFVNAKSDREIVYTKNASEAINLVAYSWGVANLKPGDEVDLAFHLKI